MKKKEILFNNHGFYDLGELFVSIIIWIWVIYFAIKILGKFL